MVTTEAPTPDKIRVGFASPVWELLRARVDLGQRAGEMAVGRHVERHQGDVIAGTSFDEVTQVAGQEVHVVEWTLPMVQLLRMRLLYSMIDTNMRTGRLMHQVPEDDPDNVLYKILWEAEETFRQTYQARHGEPYADQPPQVIEILDGAY
jgi:hypothetical protein